MATSNIETLLEAAVGDFIFSGYQLCAERGGERLSLSGGSTSHFAGAVDVGAETRFDVGSVTKALATVSVVARAVDRGLRLDKPIGAALSWLRADPIADVTAEELLNHCGGLIGWYPIFRERHGVSLEKWMAASLPSLRVSATRQKTIYSDVGFLILGLWLESQAIRVPDAFETEVKAPLGLVHTSYAPLAPDIAVAETERCLWRGRVLKGEVFDENCADLGGRCPHAGLFSTAEDLARLGAEWLRAWQGLSDWLSEATAKRFTTRTGWVEGSTWALGWDTRSPVGSSAGSRLSIRSFGHLGYPGASLWIDPDAGAVVALVTNRVHPSRLDERIRAVRPAVHDAVAELWGI